MPDHAARLFRSLVGIMLILGSVEFLGLGFLFLLSPLYSDFRLPNVFYALNALSLAAGLACLITAHGLLSFGTNATSWHRLRVGSLVFVLLGNLIALAIPVSTYQAGEVGIVTASIWATPFVIVIATLVDTLRRIFSSRPPAVGLAANRS